MHCSETYCTTEEGVKANRVFDIFFFIRITTFRSQRSEERRKASRLVVVHRINNGLTGIDKQQCLQQSEPRTRGPQRFFQETADHPALRNSFFPQTSREWNQLPQWHTSQSNTSLYSIQRKTWVPHMNNKQRNKIYAITYKCHKHYLNTIYSMLLMEVLHTWDCHIIH